jgi:hypothetical protein
MSDDEPEVSLGAMLAAESSGSMADWVKRNRAVTAIRSAADERAAKATSKASKRDAYTAKDLEGIEVQHGEEAFEEGRDVILTLKDSKILTDKGTVATCFAWQLFVRRRCGGLIAAS